PAVSTGSGAFGGRSLVAAPYTVTGDRRVASSMAGTTGSVVAASSVFAMATQGLPPEFAQLSSMLAQIGSRPSAKTAIRNYLESNAESAYWLIVDLCTLAYESETTWGIGWLGRRETESTLTSPAARATTLVPLRKLKP